MHAGRSVAGFVARVLRTELPLSALARRRWELVIALGVVLRLAQYLAGRSLWLDEGALAANILRRPPLGVLTHQQAAPLGFLLLEQLVAAAFGSSRFALRLVPLLGGIASLAAMAWVARRLLDPWAGLLALGLLAISDDLIYYASELKPYSTDVAIALGCLALAVDFRAGASDRRGAVRMGAGGALAVWFSFPAAFVLAGVGAALGIEAWRRKDAGGVRTLLQVGGCWAASLAVFGLVTVRLMPRGTVLWRFWAFALGPWPASPVAFASWLAGRCFAVFVNPLEFVTPLDPAISALPAVGLFVWGAIALARRDRGSLLLLILPVAVALGAACVRLYPFHGRLILFVVPAMLMIIAEGASVVRARFRSRAVTVVLVLYLALCPLLLALYRLAEPRDRLDYDPRGDYHRIPLVRATGVGGAGFRSPGTVGCAETRDGLGSGGWDERGHCPTGRRARVASCSSSRPGGATGGSRQRSPS